MNSGSPAHEFDELVRQYLDFVYSAALRQVGGDAHLAEDVSQAVFMILFRKWRSIAPQRLPGWLFNTTRYASKNAMKMQNRRRIHESQAMNVAQSEPAEWAELAPQLDEAIASLGSAERQVILLQFFQGQNLNEAAAILGITPAAARKRSSRAIERLRGFFASRNLGISNAALGGVISANAVQAAPALLGQTIVSAAGGTAGTSVLAIAKGVAHMKLMYWIKLFSPVAAAVLIVTSALLIAQTKQPPPVAPPVQAATAPASQQAFAVADFAGIRNLHMKLKMTGSPPSLDQEIYFDRQGSRYVMLEHFARARTIAFDDGKNGWITKTGSSLVGKTSSNLKQAEASLKAQFASLAQLGPARDASRDEVIDGAPCRFYELSKMGAGVKTRSGVWVDSDNRVRRQILVDSRSTQLIDLQYDVALDPSVFPTIDPSKATIVDPIGYLEKQFPLDGAVYTKETAGLIFAVHELRRDSEGRYQVICSTRLAESSRGVVGTLNPYSVLGRGDVMSSKVALGNTANPTWSACNTELIASLTGSGCEVGYVVLVPLGGREHSDRVHLSILVGASNELERKLRDRSAPTREKLELDLDASVNQNVTTESFTRRAYEIGDQLEPVVDVSLKERVPGDKGTVSIVSHRAADISIEKFVENATKLVNR